jgi:hypothetical protein
VDTEIVGKDNSTTQQQDQRQDQLQDQQERREDAEITEVEEDSSEQQQQNQHHENKTGITSSKVVFLFVITHFSDTGIATAPQDPGSSIENGSPEPENITAEGRIHYLSKIGFMKRIIYRNQCCDNYNIAAATAAAVAVLFRARSRWFGG